MDVSPGLDSGTTIGDDVQGASVDESSIFGQTTGSSNATWVECDKCKKVSYFFVALSTPFAISRSHLLCLLVAPSSWNCGCEKIATKVVLHNE
jgi:hypothetical protein